MIITIDEAAQALSSADNILIITHKNPDGDTCGSASGLCYALRLCGKTAYVLENSTNTPRLLPYTEPFKPTSGFSPEFIVTVDIADTSLFTKEAELFSDTVDLCIDHHVSNKLYAKNTLLDHTAAACAEIIYNVILALGTKITQEIAFYLYTGISTDTGCFKYSNTTPQTHRIAADLISLGIDFSSINNLFFEIQSRERFAIESMLLSSIEYLYDGKVAIGFVTKKMIADSGADPDDAGGLSSLLRRIQGVDIGVTITEKEDGEWKFSMRTSENADASRICSHLGGGGHPRAAGCSYTGSAEDARAAILDAIEREFAYGS